MVGAVGRSVCPVCGHSWPTTYGPTCYKCAAPRRAAEWWQTAEARTGDCRWCGRPYTTRARQRRYCGDPCRDAARRQRVTAARDARRANPQAQREHAARVARHRANASPEARWNASRYAVAVARSRRPWIARAADGRRVRAGDAVSSFVVTPDLAEWLWETCRRLECAPAALVRCAVDYEASGRLQINRASRWQGRSTERARLTIRLSVLQAAHLESAIRRPGYGGKSRALRRMLWQLKAAVDPPVSA